MAIKVRKTSAIYFDVAKFALLVTLAFPTMIALVVITSEAIGRTTVWWGFLSYIIFVGFLMYWNRGLRVEMFLAKRRDAIEHQKRLAKIDVDLYNGLD